MESESGPLDELAEAVLDGQPVDWRSAESSADMLERKAVQQLQVLARIAKLHRTLVHDTPVSQRSRFREVAPERWGRLKILERVGQGSFGEVYRAWDSKLDREVAVKLLHTGSAQTEGATVLEEARLLARVRHPNVVTVYDADEFDGRVGLWMEFIHGQNLEQILGERKKLDDREVTRIGIELCQALAAVHQAGLLHRDIKAQNLMRSSDGRLVLMDFGTGWDLDKSASSEFDAAGTPLYLAPEIFKGTPPTAQTDIYSAGVLLFHLLTGTYPILGATVQEVQEAHARGQRLELLPGAFGLNKPLAAAISRAIEPDQSKRFESIRDMLAALENVRRRTENDKRKRYWFAVGAVSLAALGLAAVPALRRLRQDGGGLGRSRRGAYAAQTSQKRALRIPNALAMGTPSPDGRYLPYSDIRTGNLALYEFTTGASRVLTTAGDGGQNFAKESIVSADGSRVAYEWADGSCQCKQVRTIDADGTNMRILYDEAKRTPIRLLEWSPDGLQLLGTRPREPDGADLVLLSAVDGSIQTIRTLSHEPRTATLSPDGRYVAYDRIKDSGDAKPGIYVFEAAGGQETPLATGPGDSHPMWTGDGSGLVFASMRTGGPGLWLQPTRNGRPDGQPQLIDKEMGLFAPLTLTRAGSLFYGHGAGLMDVYTAPIDPATGEVKGQPAAAANTFIGSNLAADWSPDGRTLVFASWRPSSRNILVFHSLDTGLERELPLDVKQVSGARWSPDGRWISIGGPDRKDVRALRLVDAESGRIVSTFLPQAAEVPPATSQVWDPNGRHVYLNRNPSRITRLDIETGEESLLYQPPADTGLSNVEISPDGQSLAFGLYLPDNSVQLMVMPSSGGSPRELLSIPGATAALRVGGWTRDGRQLLFVRVLAADAERKQYGSLWAVPSEGGEPRSLGLTVRALRDVRVSPDGTRISFTAGFPEEDLWVFENFLPGKTPPHLESAAR